MTTALPRGFGQALDELARKRRIATAQAIDAEAREQCRTLYGFIREAWPVLEPSTPFVGGWVLQALCDHLQAVSDGRIGRLLVTIPPGMMKSLAVSVFWPAWEWGPLGRPDLRYLTTSFSEANVTRDALKMRRLVTSDWYRRLWGDRVILVGDQNAKLRYENTRSGVREGRSFGSTTGARADRVIIDDPHSVDTAESDASRDAAVITFREAIVDRLNNPATSAIVVIMQRLHERDVAGAILSGDMGYDHLNLPMEFEPDRRCSTSIGFSDPRTEDGELLFPERFPVRTVEALKRDKGAYAWASQYQQRPAPRDGGLFKPEWFDLVTQIPEGCSFVRAWDLAATVPTAGRNPDWTVGLKMARCRQGIFYIQHVARMRGTPMEVQRLILDMAAADGKACRIELPQDPGQAGKAQADALTRALAGYRVKTTPVTGSKLTRAQPAAVQAQAGNVKLVVAGWNTPFLDELSRFPSGAHDDQVDTFADALNALAGQYRSNLEGWS